MSISRLKKNAATLRAYLGKDSHGVALLDDLMRQVHQIRSEYTAAIERAEKAESSAQPIRDDLAQANRTIHELSVKAQSAEDARVQAESRASILQKKLDEASEVPEEKPPTRKQKAARCDQIVRRLRTFRRLPPPHGSCEVSVRYRSRDGKMPLVYQVNEILEGSVTDDDIWYLGAAVLASTRICGSVLFQYIAEEEDQFINPKGFRDLKLWFSDSLNHEAPEEPAMVNGQMCDHYRKSGWD